MEYENYEIINNEFEKKYVNVHKEERKSCSHTSNMQDIVYKIQENSSESTRFVDNAPTCVNSDSCESNKSETKSLAKKDKGIDYLFIFFCIRVFHFAIYYFKYFLDVLINNQKFDKNQILWLFPIFNDSKKEILEMNNAEFKYFIIGYVNKFEREILTNKKMNESYRSFIEDVIYNFEWNNHSFDEYHVTNIYSFESDLHYLIDIIDKMHLPVSKNKVRELIRKHLNLFDYYTENPDKKSINVNLSDTVYNGYTYIQSEIFNIASRGFSWLGNISGLSSFVSN